MSFNAAALQMMLDKGLTLSDVVEIAWQSQGGRPLPKVPSRPANDRIKRFGSQERKAIYAYLGERDGEVCAECSTPASLIWRRGGRTLAEDGAHFTIVHPTPSLEVDHKTPLWAGGTNDPDNLWLLCVSCHKRKSAVEASQRRRA